MMGWRLTRRGFAWRTALGLMLCAVLVAVSGGRRAMADDCACPCGTQASEHDALERPSCCPASEVVTADASPMVMPDSASHDAVTPSVIAVVLRPWVGALDDEPVTVAARGPPRHPPAYLMFHALLL